MLHALQKVSSAPLPFLPSPFKTITACYQAAPNGNAISIFSGNNNEALTMTKPLLLQATNGVMNSGQQ
jgi:hypothetical protein